MQSQWQSIFAPYHLSETTSSQLARLLVQIRLPTGQILQLEGEECRGIYWVLSGELSVFRIAADGRELILRRLRSGEIVNLVSAFEDPPITLAAIRAELAADCLWLSLEEIAPLLNACPDLAQVFLRLLAKRLHQMTSLLEQIGLHSVRGRLARFLIDLADGKIPPRQYTQDEMAAQIGTVRDMVGRTLKAFEDAGLIARNRSHITLKDRKGLEQEANS
ncbi:MAG: Crp/Fnr family transcriptional regulator [Anaerolineae bacterium]|nr:Crp/Fnr family transcriptional regulator [Anaerolineae bacterium]